MNSYKKDFPIFTNYPNLIYLDNAATSQKPQLVIDAITNYYQNSCANVHRGVHQLSDASTTVFEKSKQTIANFFGAKNDELIITRNATEAMNGIAYGWAKHSLKKDDVILVSLMEHHANIVPWQELNKEIGTKLDYISLTTDGLLDLNDLEKKVNKYQNKIKLISITHISNTLGTINPIEDVIKVIKRHKLDCKISLDGAQSAPHIKINFKKLGVDFYAFSGHKMLGPMGIGGLIVKEDLLKTEQMQPWLFGGGMIESVYKNETKFNENLSERFIAGTPDVASTAGLSAACEYLNNISMRKVEQHDRELTKYALNKLSTIKEVKIIGPTNIKHRLGSVSFVYQGVHAHDVAQILDSENIAVRSGHHCTMPLHTANQWIATVRASFNIYNSKEDIDQLVIAINKIKTVFK